MDRLRSARGSSIVKETVGNMSYLSDKQPCIECKHLFDPDQLVDGMCRDCEIDLSMLYELQMDEIRDRDIEGDYQDDYDVFR